MDTREPLLIDHSIPELSERYGSDTSSGGEQSKSLLFVPLSSAGARPA